MCYLAFEDGEWAREILKVLRAKMNAGVRVRLLVDEIGQLTDAPRRTFRNLEILDHIRSLGVQVDIFRPAAPLQINNRVHAKFTAIDDRTVLFGGSNIGDYYTSWTDTNMRVDGELGDAFHRVYDFLLGFSTRGDVNARSLDVNELHVGNERLWLTVPGHHYGIRASLLDLIHRAENAVFIRAWHFLPDDEILDALCERARKGAHVNVLLSHRARVRAVDLASYIHVHKLICAGGNAHRYTDRFMHCKAVWNDRGDILCGSANLTAESMRNCFETCLAINDPALAWELRRSFHEDCMLSARQTPESHLSRSFADQALTHACNFASSWL